MKEVVIIRKESLVPEKFLSLLGIIKNQKKECQLEIHTDPTDDAVALGIRVRIPNDPKKFIELPREAVEIRLA